MRIAVVSQKGGSGKTTLSINLAVAATYGIVDMDPQLSATAFGQLRANLIGKPPVVSTSAEGNVFIDTAPHSNLATSLMLKNVDMVIVPVKPTPLDVHAAQATIRQIAAMGVPAIAVITMAITRTGDSEETRGMLDRLGISVADTVIHNRVTYGRSIASGQGVTEYEPNGSAAQEINALLLEILSNG
jgi:chromosome partitioning protein